jgi:hypothetical protein
MKIWVTFLSAIDVWVSTNNQTKHFECILGCDTVWFCGQRPASASSIFQFEVFLKNVSICLQGCMASQSRRLQLKFVTVVRIFNLTIIQIHECPFLEHKTIIPHQNFFSPLQHVILHIITSGLLFFYFLLYVKKVKLSLCLIN